MFSKFLKTVKFKVGPLFLTGDPLNYVTWLSAEYKLYNGKYCEECVRWKWKEFEEETVHQISEVFI